MQTIKCQCNKILNPEYGALRYSCYLLGYLCWKNVERIGGGAIFMGQNYVLQITPKYENEEQKKNIQNTCETLNAIKCELKQ